SGAGQCAVRHAHAHRTRWGASQDRGTGAAGATVARWHRGRAVAQESRCGRRARGRKHVAGEEARNEEIHGEEACREEGRREEAGGSEDREGETLTWQGHSTSPRTASRRKRRPSSTSSSPAWTRCARLRTSTTARRRRKKSGATARSCSIATGAKASPPRRCRC